MSRATAPAADPLAPFHPLVAGWFGARFGEPTPVQRQAWPIIAAGRHALITAPTGSGKTLTAFLWALDRLLTGAWEGGATRVLYVSPLKALNNDIQRNLLGPLEELGAAFRSAGGAAPDVRVATRSGDTPDAERRRMLRHPPEILITTPESLNLLVTSRSGRSLLGAVATVILDEVHAVVASKRGTHLITAVDRLVPIAGEFQRLALSATVRPLERVAAFVGGFRITPGASAAEPRYRPRDVAIVEAAGGKRYDLEVRFPVAPGSPAGGPLDQESIWDRLTPEIKGRIRRNRSTLVFANSRRLTEKVTRLLNEDEAEPVAYSHHGSLSREIRSVVEARLKEGRLAAIVATNSLELGIDIGSLDEVLLVQTPRSVASALQRIGRAGHQVGEVSRARFYPLHARDFLEAAVVARAALDQAIEETRPLAGCLDVLAQVILSMTATETWDRDALFALLRSSWPYRNLRRRDLDLVLDMLAGRYADARLTELKPRLSLDRLDNTVRARPGVDRLVYTSGGTIADRGYFHLRMEGSMARIGELDEEFVWERSIGDAFTLGAQSWRIRQITHNDVLVAPARGAAALAPFWRADARDRGWELSERVAHFLERCEARLAARESEASLVAWLAAEHCMAEPAARELLALLEAQRAETGCPLPHRHHVVAETSSDIASAPGRGAGPTGGGGGERQLVLHTGWGGKVNRPLALALAAAWEKRHGGPLQIFHDDACVVIKIPGAEPLDAEELLAMVPPERLVDLLRERLERTGFFGAHFRLNAGCALLLPRSDRRHRQPLWLIRQRSKRLLDAASRYPDFPILLETWRTCLEDEMELPALAALLGEVARGEIRISAAVTARPSPFAADVVWRETNALMYADDTPQGAGGPAVSRGLLRELVFSSELRPRIAPALIERLERRLQRSEPGYAPSSADELLDWVRERTLIPLAEWAELLAAADRDAGDRGERASEMLAPLASKLAKVLLPGATELAVVALDALPRLLRAVETTEPARVAAIEQAGGALSAVSSALATLGLAPEPAAGRAVSVRPAAPEASAPGAPDPLEELLADWARFHGPFRRERLIAVLGVSAEHLTPAVDSLVEAERLVVDRFRDRPEAELEICDAENVERLLRLARAEARPRFEAVDAARLPLFLSTLQGLTTRGTHADDLPAALERLFGYPAPARSWEGEILPARLDPYYPAWLDALLADTELAWFGCGRQRVSFALLPDLPLFRSFADEEPAATTEPSASGETSVENGAAAAAGSVAGDDDRPEDYLGPAALLFPDARGKFGLADLARHACLPTAEIGRRLWRLSWEGQVSNSGFQALRQAVLGRFRSSALAAAGEPAPAAAAGARRALRRFDRWRATRPFQGDWYLLPEAEGERLDALERAELEKERARVLLDRYGILFRELLQRELPPLRWPALFRALRLMELAGEVVAGHFFQGLPGLQFVAPAAFRRLREGLPDDAVYWMSAVDPASPCGLAIDGLPAGLPARLPSNHLVFHGADLVIAARGNGRELDVRVAPEHPELPRYLGFLKVLLTRAFDPLKAVAVTAINGEPAAESPYAAAVAAPFSATRDASGIRLRRRYR